MTITRNGRPAAVLVSTEELESIEETLDILSDPEARAASRESEQAVASGEVLDDGQLRALMAQHGR